jgi:hypothetical protein
VSDLEIRIGEQLASFHWLLKHEQLRHDVHERLLGVDGQFVELHRSRERGLPRDVWVYDERSLLETVVAIAREYESRGAGTALEKWRTNNG